jgi:hypothetical protein
MPGSINFYITCSNDAKASFKWYLCHIDIYVCAYVHEYMNSWIYVYMYIHLYFIHTHLLFSLIETNDYPPHHKQRGQAVSIEFQCIWRADACQLTNVSIYILGIPPSVHHYILLK